MAINKYLRSLLKEKLKRTRYRHEIAQQLDCHPNTVTNVLNYGSENPEVERALIDYANITKNDLASLPTNDTEKEREGALN